MYNIIHLQDEAQWLDTCPQWKGPPILWAKCEHG
jgi:hypothetical protein